MVLHRTPISEKNHGEFEKWHAIHAIVGGLPA